MLVTFRKYLSNERPDYFLPRRPPADTFAVQRRPPPTITYVRNAHRGRPQNYRSHQTGERFGRPRSSFVVPFKLSDQNGVSYHSETSRRLLSSSQWQPSSKSLAEVDPASTRCEQIRSQGIATEAASLQIHTCAHTAQNSYARSRAVLAPKPNRQRYD